MHTDKTGLSFLFSIRVHPRSSVVQLLPPAFIADSEEGTTKHTKDTKGRLGLLGIHFHPSSFVYLVCFVVETSVFGLNRQVAKFAKLK